MKRLRIAVMAAAALLAGCDSDVRGPVGSNSGKEKGTPSAAAGTPAQGGAPAEQPKPATSEHGK